jgi:hypothetical protein
VEEEKERGREMGVREYVDEDYDYNYGNHYILFHVYLLTPSIFYTVDN